MEIQAFLIYLANGHTEPGGRWGRGAQNAQALRPMRPISIRGHFRVLHTFCEWLVDQEILPSSPMAKLKPPIVRLDQVQPFTHEEVEALLRACYHSRKAKAHGRRDEAIVRVLLDTGVRAAELCGIDVKDVDLFGGKLKVHGKGDKFRLVHFCPDTGRAIRAYLRDEVRLPDEPLFAGIGGHAPGQRLTVNGVAQIIRRLGKRAGLHSVRCSPHTLEAEGESEPSDPLTKTERAFFEAYDTHWVHARNRKIMTEYICNLMYKSLKN